MRSKTKYAATEQQIQTMISHVDTTPIIQIAPLGAGEFNAAYLVETKKGKYVIKLAPAANASVLSYEKGMMKSEVFWYDQIQGYTDIRTPKIYYSDLTGKEIPTSYFIMELLEGKPCWEWNMTSEQQLEFQDEKVALLPQIHKMTAPGFGYIQMGLCSTWYEAIRKMTAALVEDSKKYGSSSENGEHLIAAIDKHKKLLEQVEGTMVNFDLWDSNILCSYENENLQLAWIDPERSFWGDPIADFIVLGEGQKTLLSKKKRAVEIYNRTARTKIQGTKEEEIRYAVALGYLALIEEIERYTRYDKTDEGWIRNTKDSKDMFEIAFGVLDLM